MPRFEIGNKAAEKWTEEDAIKAFEEAYNKTHEDKNILCVQDAFFAIEMRPTTAHYLINKFPVLEDVKKDINDKVISRINNGALKGDYNPTAGIWRMKQLGERDTQYQDHTTKGESLNKKADLSQLTEDELRAYAELQSKLEGD